MKRAFVSITAAAGLGMCLAPPAYADATTHLQSAIDAARSETGCPALQLDPILINVSQRAAREAAAYVNHTAMSLPTVNEIDLIPTGSGGVLRVMREMGYNTTKGRLLSGFGDYRTGGPGDEESKAIEGAVLEGKAYDALSDCTYTKYGLSAITVDDISQGWPSVSPRTYVVTSVVIAGAQ